MTARIEALLQWLLGTLIFGAAAWIHVHNERRDRVRSSPPEPSVEPGGKEEPIVTFEDGPSWTEVLAFLGPKSTESLKRQVLSARESAWHRDIVARMHAIVDELPRADHERWMRLQDEFSDLIRQLDERIPSASDKPSVTDPYSPVEWHYPIVNGIRYGISYDVRPEASRFTVVVNEPRVVIARGLIDFANGVCLDEPDQPLQPELEKELTLRWGAMQTSRFGRDLRA